MTLDIGTQEGIDQSFPTYYSKINEKLPISLKFVIYTNWFFAANGWSVLIFFLLMRFIFNISIPLFFYLIMVFPLVLLNTLSAIITNFLLRKLNIILSILLVLMNYFLIDLFNGWRISSSIGARISLEDLYPFVMLVLLVSTSMTMLQLIFLVFSKSLKTYYLNKHIYIKPQIVRNFALISILGGIPFGLLYVYYFTYIVY